MPVRVVIENEDIKAYVNQCLELASLPNPSSDYPITIRYDSGSSQLQLCLQREDKESTIIHLSVPFRAADFINRIRTLEKKSPHDYPEQIGIGPMIFYPGSSRIDNTPSGSVRLTEKERDILLALYRFKGNPMPKALLLHDVWAYAETAETHTLETHLYRLRQKIEKDPANPEYILTRADGYAIKF